MTATSKPRLREVGLHARRARRCCRRGRGARDSATPLSGIVPCCTLASQPASASRAFRFSASDSRGERAGLQPEALAGLGRLGGGSAEATSRARGGLVAGAAARRLAARPRFRRRLRRCACSAIVAVGRSGALRSGLHLRLLDAGQDLVEIEARLVGRRRRPCAPLRGVLRGLARASARLRTARVVARIRQNATPAASPEPERRGR